MRRAIGAGFAAGLLAVAVGCRSETAMNFDLVSIAATFDGQPATVKQAWHGPKQVAGFRGPERPWRVEVDRIGFAESAGKSLARIYLALPERGSVPPADAPPASAPARHVRVVLTFTVRALDAERIPLGAPRGMTAAVAGSRVAVPRDGRVELAFDAGLPSSPTLVRFEPGKAVLEVELEVARPRRPIQLPGGGGRSGEAE